MTQIQSQSHPISTGSLPRKGQRVFLHGVAHGALTSSPDGTGAPATFIGIINGVPTFQGRTSDNIFVPKDSGGTWTPHTA